MNTFIKNEINTDFDLIAKELKRARLDKKISLEEVSDKTKINIKYLKILENGDFFSLPKGLYGKNFLKQYASFLGLSLPNILEIFDDSLLEKKETIRNLFSNQVVKNKYFLAIPNLLRNLIVLLIVLIFFSYLVFSFSKINSSPDLQITYPPTDFLTSEKVIEVRGTVEEGAEIFINGKNILVGLDGSFSQKLNLKEGVNEVVFEAKKKYGKTNIIKRQILVVD